MRVPPAKTSAHNDNENGSIMCASLFKTNETEVQNFEIRQNKAALKLIKKVLCLLNLPVQCAQCTILMRSGVSS